MHHTGFPQPDRILLGVPNTTDHLIILKVHENSGISFSDSIFNFKFFLYYTLRTRDSVTEWNQGPDRKKSA